MKKKALWKPNSKGIKLVMQNGLCSLRMTSKKEADVPKQLGKQPRDKGASEVQILNNISDICLSWHEHPDLYKLTKAQALLMQI